MILWSFKTARHYTGVHPGPNWGFPNSCEKGVLGHRGKNKTSKSLWSLCILLLCDSQTFYMLIHIFAFNSHRYIFSLLFFPILFNTLITFITTAHCGNEIYRQYVQCTCMFSSVQKSCCFLNDFCTPLKIFQASGICFFPPTLQLLFYTVSYSTWRPK